MNPDQLGMILNESHVAYHASSAFGSHDLADLEPYPLLFLRRHVEKCAPPKPDSPALLFGRYFHCLALEGETVAASLFITAPGGIDRRTTIGKAAYTEFLKKAEGREVIDQESTDLAWRMVKSIREKPGVAALFTQGKPEVTFRHKMAAFTLQCRCDWFDETPAGGGPPLIIDVKTVETLSDFDGQFHKFGYYAQAAFYQLLVATVLKMERFEPQYLFVVVEKNEPFQTALRIPDAESLNIGRTEVMRKLAKLKECFDTGTWPGEPDEARTIALPEWMIRKSISSQ